MVRGQRVHLVPLDRSHKEKTRVWANDPEIARLMDRARPVSEEEHEAFFDAIARRDDCVFFAIELAENSTHVGNVWLWGIDARHRKAEIRVVVGEAAARGRGAGSEAIDLLCRYAFDRLNLHRVYAFVLSTNPAGKRAFEAAGFVPEGVLREDRWADGRFIDTHLLARINA